MRKIILTIILFNIYTNSQDISILERWDKTDKLIMNKAITKDRAIDSIRFYVKAVKQLLMAKDVNYTQPEEWVFPMNGWTEIKYRTNGKDYRDDKFDYFQGGESKGHPAHDIFILDKDSNGLEDNTGQKVEALSPVTGIVFTTLNGFKPGDFIRGGNYIKIFDPVTEAMFYFSHMDTVFLKPGDFVKAGDPVGYIGRTGRKAINGKTHLHIAYYKINDGYPEPVDTIDLIYASEKRARKNKK